MKCGDCLTYIPQRQAEDFYIGNEGPYCRTCYQRRQETGTVQSAASKASADGTVPVSPRGAAAAPVAAASTPQSRSMRSRLIGAIHAAATKAGIDADTRRALQRDCVGKDSCASMTEPELRRVLDRISPPLKGVTRSGGGCSSRNYRPAQRPRASMDRMALVRKVYALLGERPVSYAEGILKHMFKDNAPDKLEWAKPDQLWRLVCALEYDKKRKEK